MLRRIYRTAIPNLFFFDRVPQSRKKKTHVTLCNILEAISVFFMKIQRNPQDFLRIPGSQVGNHCSRTIFLTRQFNGSQPFGLQVPVENTLLSWSQFFDKFLFYIDMFLIMFFNLKISSYISNHFYFLKPIIVLLLALNLENFRVLKIVQVPVRRSPSSGTGTRPGG